MENEFHFLEFEGIQVAAFIEVYQQDEHIGYYPHNVLFYVERGQLNIRDKNRLYTIPSGSFCIVRKLTELSYFKTWTEEEKSARVDAIALRDEFITGVIKELGLKSPPNPILDPVVSLDQNPILMGLRNSLALYLAEDQSPDSQLMYLKTKEAILGILQSNPDLLALFYEFSKPIKANLKEFMHHHSLSILPLPELAKLSGRSLSTFNRDFRKAFNTSPHSWILHKRLQKARELLLTTEQKPSEIYLQLGFKDLGHFSRSFKKAFNISPSEMH